MRRFVNKLFGWRLIQKVVNSIFGFREKNYDCTFDFKTYLVIREMCNKDDKKKIRYISTLLIVGATKSKFLNEIVLKFDFIRNRCFSCHISMLMFTYFSL